MNMVCMLNNLEYFIEILEAVKAETSRKSGARHTANMERLNPHLGAQNSNHENRKFPTWGGSTPLAQTKQGKSRILFTLYWLRNELEITTRKSELMNTKCSTWIYRQSLGKEVQSKGGEDTVPS